MVLRSFLPAAALLSLSFAAHADTLTGIFKVTVTEGVTNGVGFDTAAGNPFTSSTNTASASFTYNGAINFSNTAPQNSTSTGDLNASFFSNAGTISGYAGSGTVTSGSREVANYPTLVSFLASSGSASNFAYGSYYTFDLGVQNAGTILTIRHDDGISIFQGNTQIGTSVSGPTPVTTDTIDLTSTGDTILRYARENGTPSILNVNTSASVTPEPSSFALLGTGLLGFAGVLRKRLA